MSNGFALSGVEDLTGQTRGPLRITGIASLRPVRWNVECEKCGTATQRDHMALQNGVVAGCPNSACGRAASESRSTIIQTSGRTDAVRSRDSKSARDFDRQEIQQPQRKIVWGQPSEEALRNADPSSIARYIDYTRNR
jgi:hypothetical protein